jgi:hypothetical protein
MTMPDPVSPPPLGSWARLYALVAVCAVLVMLVLWWFSASFNIRLPQ